MGEANVVASQWRLVERGRVVLFTQGKYEGRLAVVAEIIDHKRVCPDLSMLFRKMCWECEGHWGQAGRRSKRRRDLWNLRAHRYQRKSGRKMLKYSSHPKRRSC